MKLTEARRILRPPLKFGDAKQIEAHELIVQAEEAKEKIRACRRGHVHAHASKWEIAACECIAGFPDEVRVGAAGEFANDRS